MADSAVVVTAGTGTNIDTRTEATNGHHRQVVVLGDPATNAGVAPVDATAGLKVDLGADNDVVVSATNLDIRDLTNADVVTAELSAVDNAVLDTIAAKDFATQTTLAAINTKLASGTVIGDVNLGATDNAVLDAIEADTTTIAGDTTSIDAKIPALGQALAAASVPVILPSATITTLTPPAAITGFGTAANQTTIIGHLDGVEGLLTTIDGDTGTIATEVAGLLTDTELRATPVPVSGTVAVTNAGLTEVAAAINASSQMDVNIAASAISFGGTSAADDADFTAGTTPGTPVMGVYDSTPDTVTDGDLGTIGINSTRAVRTVIEAGSAAIGKLAANSGVDIGDVDVTSLPAIPAGNNNIGDVDVASIAAGDNNIGNVDIVTMPTVTVNSHAVTNAGTFATQVDGSALTALQLIDDTVFTDDAAVTLGTSKGNVAAGVAVATDGTDPTAVSAEGDAAALRTDMNRLLIVNQTHPRFWHVSADYASAQTNVSVKASPGASLSLYITDIQISNGATAGNITLLDGSGGTVLYEVYPAINGGAVLSLRSPIKLTAATALCLTSTSCTTHSVFVSGYIAA